MTSAISLSVPTNGQTGTPRISVDVWRPQPGPQKALVDCPLPEIFFGGARGGGKTDGVLGKWALKERRYGHGFNAIMFRRTTVSAEDAIERSREIYTPLGADFHESKYIWRMPNGGRVKFTYLENAADANEYQGRNVTDAWVEEAGQYPDSAPIDRLFGVLRSAHGVPIQLILTANPGGAGQHWLRQRYGLAPFPRMPKVLRHELPNGDTHLVAVIPSRLRDNLILMSRDPGYVGRLHMVGSTQLVKAWLEGDWTAIEGAFFDCWSESKHVLTPFTIPTDWLRFRSGDWGSASPFSIGWWAVVQDDYALAERTDSTGGGRDRIRSDTVTTLPRGALIRYREDYGASAPGKGLKLTAEQVATRIIEREAKDAKLAYGVFDPSAFKEDGGPSIAERINTALIKAKFAPFRGADNARVARTQGRDRGGPMGGWDQVRARMIGDGTTPMLFVFSTCLDTIRTVPVLQHDPARAEDLDTNSEDHCFAGSTLVATPHGPRRLDQLPSEGIAWDADGIARKYLNPRLTRRRAKVIRLNFDDGSSVVCTPDHRFLTMACRWVQAQDMLGEASCAYVIPSCTNHLSSAKPSKNFKISAITNAGHIFSRVGRDFIESFGRYLTGLFLAKPTFTTAMATPRTIGQQISPVSSGSPISRITAACEHGNLQFSLSIHGRAPPNGTGLKRAGNGTLSIIRRIAERYSTGKGPRLVNTATRLIWRTFARGFARTPVKRQHGVPLESITLKGNASCAAITSGLAATARPFHAGLNVEALSPRKCAPVCLSLSDAEYQDVFCLTVPEAGSFILANGLAVANCADDIRYACMSRPWLRGKEEKEAPKDGYRPAEDEIRQDDWKTL